MNGRAKWALLAVAAVAAVGGVLALRSPSFRPKVDKLTISPRTIVLSEDGQVSHPLEVTVLDQRGTLMQNVTVTFSSSDMKVATVDDNHVVMAHFTGTARIIARAADKEDSIPIEVAIPAKLRITAGQLSTTVGTPERGAPPPDLLKPTLHLGESMVVEGHVVDDLDRPLEGRFGKARVIVSGEEIVQLQPDGKTLLARGFGRASVTVSAEAAPLMLSMPVTVLLDEKSTVVVDPPAMTLKVGESRPVKLSVKGVKAPAVLWTMVSRDSTNPAVANSIADHITAAGPGKADVVLLVGNKKATVHVTVR